MKSASVIFMVVVSAISSPLAAQWANYPTPGIPRTADGKPNLAAPTPRTADGKPDLSGLYNRLSRYDRNITADLKPGDVQPWAEALVNQRMESLGKDNPSVLCLPEGPKYINVGGTTAGGMVRIIQTPTIITLLNPDLTYRVIFMDGRKLEADPNPSWMGYSVGHWDGCTLVVESNGYNDKTWLDSDGHPHSEVLRITERYRRKDFGHLTIDMTLQDPSIYAKPWTVTVEAQFAPDTELIEFVCGEAKGFSEHWVGKASDEKNREVKVDPKILAKYAGSYKELDVWNGEPVLRTIEVVVAGDKLLAGVTGKPKVQLIAQSDTNFAGFNGLGIRFSLDAKGEVQYLMEMHVSGDYRFTPMK